MKVIISVNNTDAKFDSISYGSQKFNLQIGSQSLFELSMLALKDFFDEEFIFITKSGDFEDYWLANKLDILGLKNYQLYELPEYIQGQAEEIMIVEEEMDEEESFLYYKLQDYIKPYVINKEDLWDNPNSLLYYYIASKKDTTYIKVEDDNLIKIAKNVAISEYSVAEIYYFKKFSFFKDMYLKYCQKIEEIFKEQYIAPLYQCMIKERIEIKTKEISRNYIYGLQSPTALMQIDPNYLEEKQDEISILIKEMKFEEVVEVYKYCLNKKYTDDMLAKYIIYLLDIADIYRLRKIGEEYDLEAKFKNNEFYKTYSTIIKKRTFNSLERKIKKVENLLYVDIDDRFANLLYNMSIQEYEEFIDESLEQITTPFHGLINTYKIKWYLENANVSEVQMTKIINHIAQSNFYNPKRTKYLLTLIIEYIEENYPKYLTFKNIYSYIQTIYFLLNKDLSMFEPGVEYYKKRIYKLHGIEMIEQKRLPKRPIKNPRKKPKVAVCISGMNRFDSSKILKNIKKNLVDPVNADVFIHSWNKKEIYPGLGGPSSNPDSVWVEKYYQYATKYIPQDIKYLKDFRKVLPNVASQFEEHKTIDNDTELYYEIFDNPIILLEDEKIMDKYRNRGFVRRGKLNQAKMFYGIWKSQELFKIKEQEEDFEYDYVVRVRPDYIVEKPISFEFLKGIPDDALSIYPIKVAGVGDRVFCGRRDVMQSIANIWQRAIQNDNLSPYTVDGEQLFIDSHLLIHCTLIYDGIIDNSIDCIRNKQVEADEISFPEYKEELEMDLVLFNDEERKKYKRFFERLRMRK